MGSIVTHETAHEFLNKIIQRVKLEKNGNINVKINTEMEVKYNEFLNIFKSKIHAYDFAESKFLHGLVNTDDDAGHPTANSDEWFATTMNICAELSKVEDKELEAFLSTKNSEIRNALEYTINVFEPDFNKLKKQGKDPKALQAFSRIKKALSKIH
jgi:hypothetical protein